MHLMIECEGQNITLCKNLVDTINEMIRRDNSESDDMIPKMSAYMPS